MSVRCSIAILPDNGSEVLGYRLLEECWLWTTMSGPEHLLTIPPRRHTSDGPRSCALVNNPLAAGSTLREESHCGLGLFQLPKARSDIPCQRPHGSEHHRRCVYMLWFDPGPIQ